MDKYIGKKKIKEVKTTEEKTPGGLEIIAVTYEDLTTEYLSKIMYDKVVTDEQIDDSKLRDLRVTPVVESLLVILREWGIMVGELSYISALLNKSLQYNSDQALIYLLSKYMPKPNSLDDVDYLTIDRILKEVKPTIQDVIKQ